MTKGRSKEPRSLARGRAAHGERTGSAAGGPGPGKVLGAYCLLFVQKQTFSADLGLQPHTHGQTYASEFHLEARASPEKVTV